MRVRALIMLVAVASAGCGGHDRAAPATPGSTAGTGAPAAPPPVDRALLAEIAGGLEDVLTTMAAIAEHAADCPSMARQLGALFDQSAPLFDMAKAQAADPEAAPLLTAELDGRAAVVQPLVARIAQGLERCQLDPDVARAIERMPTF